MDFSNQITTGVQQIMLGTVTRTYQQAESTLARIKAAGYDGIELNSFMIHPTPLMVRLLTRAAGMPSGNGGKFDWMALVQGSGLRVVSLHTDMGSLKRDTDAAAREAAGFKTPYVVITGMYRFDYTDIHALDGLCADLNECGRRLSEHGISLLYHNHNVEWCRVRGSNTPVTAYEYILTHTDPEYVNFEFDSYWPTEAGVNTPEVMKRLGSRMKLWHVTDRGTRINGASMTPILKSDSVELGTGNMDLELLREIALDNGITGVVLETHRNWINKDPLQSIELSGRWMREHF